MADSVRYGSPVPRLSSPRLDLESRGEQVIEFARLIGFELMPWQEYVIREAHKVHAADDSGFQRNAYRTLGVTAPRQNGKSALMRVIVLANMFLFGKVVVTMAQNRDLALMHFKDAVETVLAFPELAGELREKPRFANGQESFRLKNGASWRIVAATGDAPRGRTADLLWIDEMREIDEKTWKAAEPVTRARKNAQVWVTSNAGDAHSTQLNRLRTQGLSGAEKSVGWWEWSSDPELHHLDPEAWYQSNPALGWMIDEDVIRQAAVMDKPEQFLTETLCRWVDSLDSPWSQGKWAECEEVGLAVSPGLPTWLALDVTPDRRRADLVAGQLLADGRVALGLVQTWTSETSVNDLTLAADVSKWARHYSAQAVAFDRWTAAAVAARLAVAGFPTAETSGALFAQACDEMLSSMNSGRIVHSGQDELTAHINACAKKPTADGGWRVVRKGSTLPISAAVAAIMCVHHANKPAKIADFIAL